MFIEMKLNQRMSNKGISIGEEQKQSDRHLLLSSMDCNGNLRANLLLHALSSEN